MTTLETDYLVIGAGAAGMGFTDELIADSDADVVVVERAHRPGGHWNDAYPFVRLHQPAAFYGVNSRRLGTDVIETTGPNAGWYPRSSAGTAARRRRDLSRNPDPGDARPVVRHRSRCALHARQRSRHHVRARTRL